MINSILRFVALLAVAGVIVAAGWNEPLRYRFMAHPKITTEELALLPPPPERTAWQPTGTSLDRAPYKIKKGRLVFSRNFDQREVGVATETAQTENRLRKGL